jgi:hypothetical protein
MIASEITEQAAKVYLNDSLQALWSNTVLLPVLVAANEELQALFDINEIPVIIEDSSPVTSVESGDTELDEYPTDLLLPLKLFERTLDSDEEWIEVREVEKVDPNNSNSQQIIEWAYHNNKIYINPPTTDREIYLEYKRTLTALSAAGSTVELPAAKAFLSVRTAQIAAKNIGNNPTKAAELEPDVRRAEHRLIQSLVKNKQGVGGARRKGYKGQQGRRFL